jgi:nitrogen PTS system EIIA component
MLISDLIKQNLVCANLRSSDRDAVLSEILDFLARNQNFQDKDNILRALLERERNGSTGIGNGVAVPHARIDGLSESVLFVGVSQQGINFASLDSKPVRLVILVLSPVSQTGIGLKLLANIARLVNDKYFTSQMMNASTDEELFNILRQSSIDKEKSFLIK